MLCKVLRVPIIGLLLPGRVDQRLIGKYVRILRFGVFGGLFFGLSFFDLIHDARWRHPQCDQLRLPRH